MSSPRTATERDGVLPDYASELAHTLRRAIDGEVRFTPGDRALYAYDASIFRQVPIGVVLPRHADDVETTLAICGRFGAPVFGRGCGTGLAGQTVNSAVVLDFSKHMHDITSLDPQARRAIVQPGVICDQLRDAAEEHGLTFGPDPATHDHATLGGMIGNNSCGTHSVMAGKTVDNIEELDVVTYDGTRMRVGPTPEHELDLIIASGGRRGSIYAGLKQIRDRYADVIRNGMPDIPRRVSGYNLDQLLPENGFNAARALVGTESTCALTLEATCSLVHSPPERSLVVLGYPDIPSSGDDVEWLMDFDIIALEFMSREVLQHLHAKGFDFGGDSLLPDGDAWLLVEFGGDTKEEANDKAEALFAALRGRRHAPSHQLFEDRRAETTVWEARKHGVGSTRMPQGLGGHPGWPNWEDAAVPPARMGDYLRDFQQLLCPARSRRSDVRALGARLHPLPDRLGPAPSGRHHRIPLLHGGGCGSRGLLRRFALGRARRRSRTCRAVAQDVRTRADACLRGLQAGMGPEPAPQSPQAGGPLPSRQPSAGGHRLRSPRADHGIRIPRGPGLVRRGRRPVLWRRSMPSHRWRDHVPELHGDARGEALHPGACPPAAGDEPALRPRGRRLAQ